MKNKATKTKFEKEPSVCRPELKSILQQLMNKAAEDFQEVAVDNPSEEKYREKIGIGLKRIDPTELRLYSEDEDMVRMYYEELMDIVHLENSGGRLNQWRYGFSPEELKQLQNASKFD